MKDLKPNVELTYRTGVNAGRKVPLKHKYHVTKEGIVHRLTDNKIVERSHNGWLLYTVVLEGYNVSVMRLVIEAYYDGFKKGMSIIPINKNWSDCSLDNLKVYNNKGKEVKLKLKEEPKELVKMEPNLLKYNGLDYPLHVTEDGRVYHTKNNHWLNTKGSNKVKVKVAGKVRELSLSWIVVFVHNNELYNEMIHNHRGQTLRHNDGNCNNNHVDNLGLPIKEGVNEMVNLTDMSNEDLDQKIAEMMAERERRNRKVEIEKEITELEESITVKSNMELSLMHRRGNNFNLIGTIRDKIAKLQKELEAVIDENNKWGLEYNKLRDERVIMIVKVNKLRYELKNL